MDVFVSVLAWIFCKCGNWLILLTAGFNTYVFFKIKFMIKDIDKMLKPQNDKEFQIPADMDWNNEQVAFLGRKRKSLLAWYTCYSNVTAVFPLLGILGTVAALVTYSADTMMDNFMVALGTTLLGVLCAIVFKSIDSIISGPLDIDSEAADHIILTFKRKEL